MANHRKHPAVTPNEVMAVIIEAARKGERCPISSPSFPTVMTAALARAGRIRIDVYPTNWRVITITEGQHLGQATAPCPNAAWRPYKTIQREVAHG